MFVGWKSTAYKSSEPGGLALQFRALTRVFFFLSSFTTCFCWHRLLSVASAFALLGLTGYHTGVLACFWTRCSCPFIVVCQQTYCKFMSWRSLAMHACMPSVTKSSMWWSQILLLVSWPSVRLAFSGSLGQCSAMIFFFSWSNAGQELQNDHPCYKHIIVHSTWALICHFNLDSVSRINTSGA